MNYNNFKYDFLTSTGFSLIEAENSRYFGDYYDTFANTIIAIRFSSSKSLKSAEVCNINDEEWFDLTLIRALICGEENLIVVIPENVYMQFLTQYLTNICDSFNDLNYKVTKKNLELLEKKRVRQMFPNIRC